MIKQENKKTVIAAILGISLIITGVIVKTVAYNFYHGYRDWGYTNYILWNSIGHIVQAIGVLMVSASFVLLALVDRRVNPTVGAALVIGSMILIALFIIDITFYGYFGID